MKAVDPILRIKRRRHRPAVCGKPYILYLIPACTRLRFYVSKAYRVIVLSLLGSDGRHKIPRITNRHDDKLCSAAVFGKHR